MSTLDHPNVLTLIGVCLDGGPAPYIVMPFMVNGDLHSHLKKERNNLVIMGPDPNQDLEKEIDSVSSLIIIILQMLLFLQKIAPVSCKLIDMSLQIAKGMEYLAGERLIHRDLATRNCM